MERIALPTDFLGLNVYAGNFVRAGADGQPEVLPFPRGYPEGALWWLKITPQSLYWAVRLAAEVFGVKSFYMTESGATFDDDITPAARCSICTGANICEATWSSCTEPWPRASTCEAFSSGRCSTISSGPKDTRNGSASCTCISARQRRTPKLSSRWYSEVIRNNRIV